MSPEEPESPEVAAWAELRAALHEAADGIRRRDIEAENSARERIGIDTPRGAELGRLAEWSVWLSGAHGAFPPGPVERVRVLTIGAPAPPGHPVHALAVPAGVTTETVPLPDGSSSQVARAGIEAVEAAVDAGCDLLVLTGLVDLSVCSTLVALLLRLSATEVVGKSPQLDDAAWAERVAAIRDLTHSARRHEDDPVAMVDALGSPELVALVAMMLRAAARRTPVLLDGAADVAAALCASRIAILGSWWWFAAAGSSSPATTRAIEALGLEPLVDLGGLLDGGAAALTALPLLRSAQQLAAGVDGPA